METSFAEKVGALMALMAMLVIAYLAVAGGSEQAAGGLLAVLAAATGFFLRGKVQAP